MYGQTQNDVTGQRCDRPSLQDKGPAPVPCSTRDQMPKKATAKLAVLRTEIRRITIQTLPRQIEAINHERVNTTAAPSSA